MATIQNITIDQDCDYTETLTVKDSTGTVVDLSNETITATLRKTHLATSSTSFTTELTKDAKLNLIKKNNKEMLKKTNLLKKVFIYQKSSKCFKKAFYQTMHYELSLYPYTPNWNLLEYRSQDEKQ